MHRSRRRMWLPVVGASLVVVWVSGIALASVPPSPPDTPASTESTPPSSEAPDTSPAETSSPTTTTPAESSTTTTDVPATGVDIDLIPLCTSSGDFAAGTRTFRVDNNSAQPVEITLRNVDTGGSTSGTAPPGQSTWDVPAGDGANTTEVVVDDETVVTSASTNLPCAALHGNAECDASTGTTTITWTVSNNDGSSAVVVGDSRGVAFTPNPDAPHGSATGTEVIEGPASDQQISESVTVRLADGGTSELTTEITAAACSGPAAPPEVTFTFSKTASASTAAVGDTVEYVYCGQNTSEISLEVVRLVDDRLGVVIELPDVETVVAPGDSLCNTDIGQPVTHEVALADLGTTITNHAVVTVRTQEPTPRQFQATATAEVDVALPTDLFAALRGPTRNVTICHATESDSNPWNSIEVDDSAVQQGSGHNADSHQDGRDIIPPGPWDPDGRNWDAEGWAIWVNNCNRPKAVPAAPTVVQATCANGVVTAPTVRLASTVGITYAASPAGPYSGSTPTTVTVTATLRPAFVWGQIPPGWTASGSTYQYTVVLTPATCDQVLPAAPTVTQALCRGGVLEPPVLVLPETDGIAYTAAPTPAPGKTVVVTATLTAPGAAWQVSLPPGWTRTSDTLATYSVTFNDVKCTPVSPVDPTVVQATCTSGTVTEATVTTATGPVGVAYLRGSPKTDEVTGVTTVTVTAVVLAGHEWGQLNDWTRVDALTATLTVTLKAASCVEVTPVAPTVTQAACVGGVVTAPTLTLATTDGVTYDTDIDPPHVAGGAVTVTATLAATGVAWPEELPSGWTRTSDTTATYNVTFNSVSCAPVIPVAPAVNQATCANGAVTAPSIVPPATAGITYTLAPPGPFVGTQNATVTVTATLADGSKWGQMTAGWTQQSPTTATFVVELVASSCAERRPVAPAVEQAVCVGGFVDEPTLTFAITDGIGYIAAPAPPYTAGQSVTVTATLSSIGVAWPPELPTGWTRTSDTTANYPVTFNAVTCTPVRPRAPTVTQATCANGVVTAPKITLAKTPGVTYRLDRYGPYDGTQLTIVTVIASVDAGFSWGQMRPGWTQLDTFRATYTVTLSPASCQVVTPAAPAVTQAQCVGGVVTAPTLTLATTDGVTYDPAVDPPYSAGTTVVVTATLRATGVAWPLALPQDWTRTSDTTATTTVTFDAVTCKPAIPADPKVVQATCANGVVTAPTVEPTLTPGITYALDPQGPYDGTQDTTVTLTATLDDGYAWGQLPGRWTLADPTEATLTVELTAASCGAVKPAAPTVTEAFCAGGILWAPTLTLPVTDAMTYTAPEGPYAPGQSVTVTATLDPAGVGWPSQEQMPPRWTITSATTATYVVTFNAVVCTQVVPANPSVTQATCASGAVTAPTIALADTTGITYVADPQGPYDGTQSTTVTVTATLSDGFAWGQVGPSWTRLDTYRATISVMLVGMSCAERVPVQPAVTQAVCANGVVTAPTLTLASTDAVTYDTDADPPYAAGATVTVTATLDPVGVGWPTTLPDGWVRTSDTVATTTVTFDAVVCRLGTPTDPAVIQATCASGVVSEPTIVLPRSRGITYGADPPGPYDGTEDVEVIVTALARPGYGWEPLPAGWTQVDAATATFTVTLVGTSCDERFPVQPTITQAVCANGVVTAPTLTVAATDGITYDTDIDPPYAPGATVVVTATIDPAGVAWPSTMPAGWDQASDTTATFEATFQPTACKQVTPVAPIVAPATCAADGRVTSPAITLPMTTGVVYTISPPGPITGPGEAVVTATVDDGFAWGESPVAGFAAAAQPTLPGGWTVTSPSEATLAVALPASATCVSSAAGGTLTPTATVSPPGPAGSTGPGELARTGAASVRLQLILAALVLAAGSLFVMVAAGRRRQSGAR